MCSNDLAEPPALISARGQNGKKQRVSLFANVLLRRVLLPVAVLFGSLLPYFAVLRETPDFWTNAGGYPLWLREWVGCFIPMFLGHLVLVFFIASSLVLGTAQSVRTWWLEAGILALVVMLSAVSAAIALANNISNLIDGRPVHYHQHTRTFQPRHVSAARLAAAQPWAKHFNP